MLATAESMLGPYVWGRYDLLVLPPSFPCQSTHLMKLAADLNRWWHGEPLPDLCDSNVVGWRSVLFDKNLSGLTIILRSLANVVAHEIAHSWTGNLVTNKTWEHFWCALICHCHFEPRLAGSTKGLLYFSSEKSLAGCLVSKHGSLRACWA